MRFHQLILPFIKEKNELFSISNEIDLDMIPIVMIEQLEFTPSEFEALDVMVEE